MPAMDEGWWEAILAEEGTQARPRDAINVARPAARDDSKQAHRVHPNWDKVKLLFEKDEIVDMRVAACNRGGLRVEGVELEVTDEALAVIAREAIKPILLPKKHTYTTLFFLIFDFDFDS